MNCAHTVQMSLNKKSLRWWKFSMQMCVCEWVCLCALFDKVEQLSTHHTSYTETTHRIGHINGLNCVLFIFAECLCMLCFVSYIYFYKKKSSNHKFFCAVPNIFHPVATNRLNCYFLLFVVNTMILASESLPVQCRQN